MKLYAVTDLCFRMEQSWQTLLNVCECRNRQNFELDPTEFTFKFTDQKDWTHRTVRVYRSDKRWCLRRLSHRIMRRMSLSLHDASLNNVCCIIRPLSNRSARALDTTWRYHLSKSVCYWQLWCANVGQHSLRSLRIYYYYRYYGVASRHLQYCRWTSTGGNLSNRRRQFGRQRFCELQIGGSTCESSRHATNVAALTDVRCGHKFWFERDSGASRRESDECNMSQAINTIYHRIASFA